MNILILVRSLVLKIAFYVSGGASRLLKLFLKDSIVLRDTHLVVFDDKRLEIERQCEKRNIALININYQELNLFKKERNKYLSKTLLDSFRFHHITHCFCFGRLLLEGELLEVYKDRIINFHPSLLPLFAGNRAIDRAREAGAFLLGNTAHFVDSGMDSGAIIMQSIIKASEYRGYESVLGLQIPMIEEIYQLLKEDRIELRGDSVVIKSSISTPSFYPALREGI